MQQIYGKSQIALRKVSGKNENLTAGALKKDGAINNLLQLDEGYRVLRTVRGSPHILSKLKRIFCINTAARSSYVIFEFLSC